MKKLKLVMIGDIPLVQSGVGLQLKYVIDHLASTGKYQIIVLGGAIKHPSYNPFKVKEWGDDVLVIPVNGYGDPGIIRQILDFEKPDAIFCITDPRYYVWLFEMIGEVHQQCPLIYWNLWDNADEITWPKYNRSYYDTCDALPAINKLTYKFLKENGWADKASYIPHGVPAEDFKILSGEDVLKAKKTHFGEASEKKFVAFYNSRNALRKRTGTLMMAWRSFLLSLPEEERDNCVLAMKTPPKDPEGQDLFALIRDIPDLKGRVAIVDSKFPNNIMCEFYNIADVTLSLSSEEGFGLSILESLYCGTPVICTKTGGMQDQVIDDETGEVFGFALEPDARILLGSQQTPYIWSDCVNHDKAGAHIRKMYDAWKLGGHKEVFAGERARKSVLNRFSLERMQADIEHVIVNTVEKFQQKKEDKIEGLVRVVEV